MWLFSWHLWLPAELLRGPATLWLSRHWKFRGGVWHPKWGSCYKRHVQLQHRGNDWNKDGEVHPNKKTPHQTGKRIKVLGLLIPWNFAGHSSEPEGLATAWTWHRQMLWSETLPPSLFPSPPLPLQALPLHTSTVVHLRVGLLVLSLSINCRSTWRSCLPLSSTVMATTSDNS